MTPAEMLDQDIRLRSIQDYQAEHKRHIYALASAGVFAGHTTAQAVYDYDVFNVAFVEGGNRRPGFVMDGCIYPAAVAQRVSCTPRAVEDARKWLHEQRLEENTDNGMSIRPLSLDEQSEANRLKLLAEVGPAERPKLRTGPKAMRPHDDWASRAEIEPDAQQLRTQFAIVTNSVRNSGGVIANSVRTYSSRSSSTFQTSYTAESATPTSGSEGEKERGEEAGAQPSSQPRWYVDAGRESYRPAGRSRIKLSEVEFVGSEDDLRSRYGPFFTGPDDDNSVTSFGRESWLDEDDDPAPAPNPPRRGKGQYDNRFLMGTGKNGPYFTRASTRPGRANEHEVELTADEAVRLMTVKGAEHLELRRQLYTKYNRRVRGNA